MDKYPLKILSMWISALCLSVLILVVTNYKENKYVIKDKNRDKNITVITEIKEYEVIKKYNNSLEKGIINIIKKGENGLTYNGKELKKAVAEVREIGTKEEYQYIGRTTGYGANCKGCSGTVSCRTKEGNKFNLKTNGVYYNDNEYGKVKIISADTKKFNCGTIIEINNGTIEPFIGIVLDTGGDMKSASKKGLIHIDVAYNSEQDKEIYKITSNKAKFNIKRWGW